jgi:hypothetical protein
MDHEIIPIGQGRAAPATAAEGKPAMSPTRKSRISLLSATAATAVVLAACSSAPAPSASSPTAGGAPTDPAAYASSLEVPIVQCFIDHHLIAAKRYRSQPWYKSGRVINTAQFANWWGFNQALRVRHKQLNQWTHDAAFSNKWPASLCGPRPSPSAR